MTLWLLILLLGSSQAQSLRSALRTSLTMSTPFTETTTNTSELAATKPINNAPNSSFINQSTRTPTPINSTKLQTVPELSPTATNTTADHKYPFYFITPKQLTSKSPGIVVKDSKEGQASLTGLQLSHLFEFELEGFPSTNNGRAPFYEMQMRYSSPSGDGAFLLYHVTQDMNGGEELVMLANVTDLNATGSWTRYETRMVTSEFPLPSLLQNQTTAKLRCVVRQAGFNWMWFYFIAGNIRDVPGMTDLNPRRPEPRPPAPGRLPFFHKFITVNDFVAGSDDLIIEDSINEGRNNFGQLNRTSWLQFRLSVPVSGYYKVHVRLSSPGGDGSFHLMRVKDTAETMARATTLTPSQGLTATGGMAPPVSFQRPTVTVAGPTTTTNTTALVPGMPAPAQTTANATAIGPEMISTTSTATALGQANGTSSPSKDSLELIASFNNFSATGSWDQYTRNTQEIVLEQGEHLYSINVTAPGFNLVWLYFEPSDLMEAIDERGTGL